MAEDDAARRAPAGGAADGAGGADADAGIEAADRKPYVHPAGFTPWMKADVLPLLAEGMEAVLAEAGRYKSRLVDGSEFPDGYRDPEWAPWDPVEWLARWLREHNPRRVRPPSTPPPPERLPVDKLEYEDLTRDEKLQLCFMFLDKDGGGSLDMEEVMVLAEVAGGFNPADAEGALAKAREQLIAMDTDGDGLVDEGEFVTAMRTILEPLDDAEYDKAVRGVLSRKLYADMTKEEKYDLCFRQLDRDNSGGVTIEELAAFGSSVSGVENLDDAVLETLEALDADGSGSVEREEFHMALEEITAGLSQEDFEEALKRLFDVFTAGADARRNRAAGSGKSAVEEALEGIQDGTLVA